MSFRLEEAIQPLKADELKSIARFLNPAAKSTNIAAAKAAIQQALDKPDLLGAALQKLSKRDLYLLGLVRENGGKINGWELIARAVLLGFAAPQEKYNYRYAGVKAFVASLIAKGLLLPLTHPNYWQDGDWYSFRGEEAYLLAADERILQALLLRPAIEPEPLEYPKSPATLTRPSPFLILLELQQAFQILSGERSIPLTKDGDLNKTLLKRLGKQAPKLDMVLLGYLLRGMGLLEHKQDHLEPRDQGFWQRPVQEQLAAVLEAYGRLPGDLEGDTYRLSNLAAMRQGLVLTLALVKEPGTLKAVGQSLIERTLQYLEGSRYSGFGGEQSEWAIKSIWAWLERVLSPEGLPARLGLLSFGKNPQNQTLIARGLAYDWLENAPQATSAAPTWLIQPNFELLVYLEHLTPSVLGYLSAAELLRLDAQTALYRLTRESVYRYLEQGHKLDDLLAGLQARSAAPIPAAVQTSLGDWAHRRERLQVQAGVTLLEFENQAGRDQALGKYRGEAIGERYIALKQRLSDLALTHYRYDQVPQRVIRFEPDGRFRLSGAPDFLLRQLLELTTPEGSYYRFDPQRLGASKLNVLALLQPRLVLDAPLPEHLRLLLSIWSGSAPAPSVAETVLFQHPQAAQLAKHPAIEPLLGGMLVPGYFWVKPGKVEPLLKVLQGLHIVPGSQLVKEQEASELQTNLPTRKLREMLEQAILEARTVRLEYAEEKFGRRGWYNSGYRGAKRNANVRPIKVIYEGSAPYVQVLHEDQTTTERIRIGYITGIEVL